MSLQTGFTQKVRFGNPDSEDRSRAEQSPQNSAAEQTSISRLMVPGLLLCSVFFLVFADSQLVLIGEIFATRD